MHILFLTDNFPPEVNAPATRTYEHCREWVKSGHSVTVITCFPNFPNGKIFTGYKNLLWSIENINGIKVIRVWSYIAPNQGFLKRIIDYISFMFSAIFASCFVRNIDLIIGTSPQFFTVVGAFFVSIIRRKPWVFELRDIWPQSIIEVGAMRQSNIIKFLEKIEIFLYRHAHLIIVVTKSFRENLIQRGISREKIIIITNGVDLDNFTPLEKDQELLIRYGLTGKFVIGYVGTLGLAHSLDTVIYAAKDLNRDVNGEFFKFLFIGDGAEKNNLKDMAKMFNLSNVIFIDMVSKSDVVRYLSLLDVSIIHLKKSELFKKVIPSKLFECMSMGIPVIHGVQGESASIIQDEGVGICFEPENHELLAFYIKELAKNRKTYSKFKRNGPISAKKYDRKLLATEMLAVLMRIRNEK